MTVVLLGGLTHNRKSSGAKKSPKSRFKSQFVKQDPGAASSCLCTGVNNQHLKQAKAIVFPASSLSGWLATKCISKGIGRPHCQHCLFLYLILSLKFRVVTICFGDYMQPKSICWKLDLQNNIVGGLQPHGQTNAEYEGLLLEMDSLLSYSDSLSS